MLQAPCRRVIFTLHAAEGANKVRSLVFTTPSSRSKEDAEADANLKSTNYAVKLQGVRLR
jgi:hypothetical protein